VARDARGCASGKAKDSRGMMGLLEELGKQYKLDRKSDMMMAAKELWPDLDVETAYLATLCRPRVSIPGVPPSPLPPGLEWNKGRILDGDDIAMHNRSIEELERDWGYRTRTYDLLMTTTGYALAWCREFNLVFWYDDGGQE